MKFHRPFSISAVLALLAAFPITLLFLLSHAAEASRDMTGARVVRVNESNYNLRTGASTNRPRVANPGTLSTPNQRLIIPGNSTASAVIDFVKNGQSQGFALSTGRSRYETRYFYTCSGQGGTFTIAWANAQSSGCPSFQVKTSKTIGPTSPANRNLLEHTSSLYASNRLLIVEQSPIDYTPPSVYYCSAQAEEKSDSAWGTAVSLHHWDLFSPEDPCTKAIEECESSSNGSCLTDKSERA